MAVKTIAVELSVYERLAHAKRGSESFTEAIARLIEETERPLTCRDAVQQMKATPAKSLSEAEARKMEKVIRGNRRQAAWPLADLS